MIYHLTPFYFQVLSSYINPGSHIPKDFEKEDYDSDHHEEKNNLPVILAELLSQSCLVPAISSYLRNDSGNIYIFFFLIYHIANIYDMFLCIFHFNRSLSSDFLYKMLKHAVN